jgi:hypothetical protein
MPMLAITKIICDGRWLRLATFSRGVKPSRFRRLCFILLTLQNLFCTNFFTLGFVVQDHVQAGLATCSPQGGKQMTIKITSDILFRFDRRTSTGPH